MTIDKLHEVYLQLDAQCTALRARIAEVQRECTSLTAEYAEACRALGADETNQELGRTAIALREKVAIAESKLRGVQLLLIDQEHLTAAAYASLAAALAAQNAESQERELQEKRRLLTEACRNAQTRRDELADQILAAKATAEQKGHAFFMADYFFREALKEYEALATDFVISDEEIAEHHQEVEGLKAERLTAMRERDEAITSWGTLQRAWQDAHDEYVHTSNVVRWNLPPAEAKRRAIPAVA